jgi:hypothetical protein
MKLVKTIPLVLYMQPGKWKLDEVYWKYSGLVQQNGFSQAYFHGLLCGVKGATKPNTYQSRM